MFVKICGTTNEADALLAVALGADAVGFIFAPSSRQIAVDQARHIAKRLPVDVLTVGVFRNELPEQVVKTTSRAALRAVQLHGTETTEDTAWISARVPTTIKAFSVGHPGLGFLAEYNADIVLIDSAQPGSGQIFDWSLAEDAPLAGHRLMLAGGLNPDNVANAIKRVRPWGVDVASGVEISPGHKDPAKLRNFIHTAKTTKADDGEAVTSTDNNLKPALYDWETDI